MAGDYVPHSEVKLVDWAERFVAFLEEHDGETRIPPGELAAVRLEFDEFVAAYNAHKTAQSTARAACRAKDAARRPLVDHLRSLARRVQIDPTAASEVKNGAGAIIGKSPRHPKLSTSEDRPFAIIDGGQRLRHVFRVFNQNSGGIHKARPCDVRGCELWRQIGVDSDGWEFVGWVLGRPLKVSYSAEDGGRQVRYRLRWVTHRGETSSWSSTQTATVAA